MQRFRSSIPSGRGGSPEDGALLDRHQQARIAQRASANDRHSGIHRKLVSALRSLTNSGKPKFRIAQNIRTIQIPDSDASYVVSAVESASPPESNIRKISQLFIQDEPTVVHRAQFKSRPSIIEIEPSTSPSTSSKSSDPRPAQSTSKTSLDFSSGVAQRISENKNMSSKHGSDERPLAPIAEVDMIDAVPVPSEFSLFQFH